MSILLYLASFNDFDEMHEPMKKIHLTQALLPTGWASNVRLTINESGDISTIETDIPGAQPGCLLPGMANLHSHAHQRAMVGLAERAGHHRDSFWTWRSIMYGFLQTLQPHHLQAIAAQLYIEMLKAGYTRVAEFQYLHHQPNGQHYDNPAEMSLRTLQAARDVGIGMTNLPVHYQFSGFGQQPLEKQQQRFANDPELFLQLFESLQTASANDPNNLTGIAAHSLRAVSRSGLTEVLAALPDNKPLPIHIHIAEQTQEVDDCIAWSGARPVSYLYDNFAVDQHWCLIHATHMTADETACVAKSRAVAGLCPTTEGNLGDGFFDAAEYLKHQGIYGIGSDSHISISPTEELRWLEYGQRLLKRSRNVLAGGDECSTGRTLFDNAVIGGAQACGHNSGAIQVGMRADLIVLDTTHPRLCEREGDAVLDSWIFATNTPSVREVYVGGKHVIQQGYHPQEAAIATQFQTTLNDLRLPS